MKGFGEWLGKRRESKEYHYSCEAVRRKGYLRDVMFWITSAWRLLILQGAVVTLRGRWYCGRRLGGGVVLMMRYTATFTESELCPYLQYNRRDLAAELIQRDLQSCVHTVYMRVVPGIKPTTSAMLYQLSYKGPWRRRDRDGGERHLGILCLF